MYRGNCTITTATEEVENGCFGTNGSCEIPSILSHSEFATLHQSIINEDYSLNMYADIIDGIVSPPSASNNIERNNLEAYVRNPFDDFITGHPRPTSTSNYTKTLQVKGKRCPVKGLKKTGLRSTKTANVSSREVLKAYRIVHPSVSKDGHTKVATSRGLRDRRIRLSFETAIKFFVIQDRLGFDQPSKALEWLLEKSRHAIDELPTISPSGFGDSLSSSMTANPHRSQWRIENLGLTDQPYTLQEQPINNVWARDPVDERAHICSCLNPSLNYGKCEIQSSSVNHVLNWKATAFNQ